MKVTVVGAGFAGAVVAERLASAGHDVLVIDARDHIAGNAYDEDRGHGLVHVYGPHLFHTNSDRVMEYLSRFTSWRPYEHRVMARVRDDFLVPMPVNADTLRMLFNAHDPEAWIASHRVTLNAPPRNAVEAVLERFGPEVWELLFRGYTEKQWGIDPTQLGPSVTSRIPVRFDRDDRYFTDAHQWMPADGYTAMFARILDHPRIRVELGRYVLSDDPAVAGADVVVWTGELDRYFNYGLGVLPWRSLEFEYLEVPVTAERPFVFPVTTINETSPEVAWTRTTEMGRVSGHTCLVSTLVREYATDHGEPYYPVPGAGDEMAERYRALAEKMEPRVVFLGRLGSYRYYNMDQVTAQALHVAAKIAGDAR